MRLSTTPSQSLARLVAQRKTFNAAARRTQRSTEGKQNSSAPRCVLRASAFNFSTPISPRFYLQTTSSARMGTVNIRARAARNEVRVSSPRLLQNEEGWNIFCPPFVFQLPPDHPSGGLAEIAFPAANAFNSRLEKMLEHVVAQLRPSAQALLVGGHEMNAAVDAAHARFTGRLTERMERARPRDSF